jgi:hypothetical protein
VRLAIRISKVVPIKAKSEDEKAISRTYGFIENYNDNFKHL